MNHHLRFALVLAAVLVTALAVWVIVARPDATPPEPEPSSPERPAASEGSAIYANGQFGFFVVYPEDFAVSETFASSYHLQDSWRALSQASGTPVLSLTSFSIQQEDAYPRYYQAQVRIGASSDPVEVARCTKAATENGETSMGERVFGDTVFSVFSFQSAGAMQYLKGESYRTVHGGSCFAVERVAFGSSYREDPPRTQDIPDAQLEEAYAALLPVVESFRFAR